MRTLHPALNLDRGPHLPERVRRGAEPAASLQHRPHDHDRRRQARAGGHRELVSTRWGLVPFFWKMPLKEMPATFNARAETVSEKPMFREAFRRRRCIIPASGFFERTGEKADKTPHLFSAADGSPVLAFAGLWERWKNPEGDEVLSATVIVSGASEWMIPYHDRMPVLLSGADIDGWLNGTLGQDGLKPAAASALRDRTVSKRVNRTGVGDDDPTIVEPAQDDLLLSPKPVA